MTNFVRDAIASVLASTLNEFIVLSHTKHLRSSKIQEKEVDKKAQGLERKNLPAKTLNEIKLNNDVKKLIDIYLETLNEIQRDGTFDTLLKAVNEQTKKNKEEAKVIEDYKVSMSELSTLQSRLIEFKSEADTKLIQESETLNNLKSEWRIITKINELEYELVKKWEHSRFTQAVILCERDEEILKGKLIDLLTKSEEEQIVINNFQAYSKTQIDHYSELIDMWKEKYSKDMDELSMSISEKKKKIKEVNKIYEKHYEIYCEREKFIAEYLEQQAEQNRLRELQKKRIQSAVRIQAWWRGMMVRRCLGPYRKKSKKGKKGKKSK